MTKQVSTKRLTFVFYQMLYDDDGSDAKASKADGDGGYTKKDGAGEQGKRDDRPKGVRGNHKDQREKQEKEN